MEEGHFSEFHIKHIYKPLTTESFYHNQDPHTHTNDKCVFLEDKHLRLKPPKEQKQYITSKLIKNNRRVLWMLKNLNQ